MLVGTKWTMRTFLGVLTESKLCHQGRQWQFAERCFELFDYHWPPPAGKTPLFWPFESAATLVLSLFSDEFCGLRSPENWSPAAVRKRSMRRRIFRHRPRVSNVRLKWFTPTDSTRRIS